MEKKSYFKTVHGLNFLFSYFLQDNLYNFMKWRYLLDDIMYMMTHDFLSSIIKYSGADKVQ